MPNQVYEFQGCEFDWFLMDGKERLALCSSAGFGEVPLSVLDGLTEDRLPIDQIPDLVNSLPELGSHRVEGHGPGSCDEFKQLANRGIFVFDWQHWRGPYERIVAPEVFLSAKDLNTVTLAKLRAVVVETLDFEHHQSFQVAELCMEFVSGNSAHNKPTSKQPQ